MKDNENLILGGFRLISLKCHCGCGLVVYKEKSLGPETEVPYFLIPGKETKNIVKIIANKMKPEVAACNDQNNPLIINVLGCEIKMYCDIKLSQLDRKMIDLLCGCGGGICHLWLVGLWSFLTCSTIIHIDNKL